MFLQFSTLKFKQSCTTYQLSLNENKNRILFVHTQAHFHSILPYQTCFNSSRIVQKFLYKKQLVAQSTKKENSPNNNNQLKTGWSGFWKKGCSLSKMKGVGMGFKRNLLQGQWTTHWRTVSTHWRATLNCRAQIREPGLCPILDQQ